MQVYVLGWGGSVIRLFSSAKHTAQFSQAHYMYFLKIFFSVYKYHVTGWFLLRYYILLNTVKHWQMLDYYLTVYFKLPLHILRPVKAEQLTICYGVHVWHILSIFHFIWTKRQSRFSTLSPKVFQLPKQFSLYNCKSNLHLGKNEEGARTEKSFYRVQPLSPGNQ